MQCNPMSQEQLCNISTSRLAHTLKKTPQSKVWKGGEEKNMLIKCKLYRMQPLLMFIICCVGASLSTSPQRTSLGTTRAATGQGNQVTYGTEAVLLSSLPPPGVRRRERRGERSVKSCQRRRGSTEWLLNKRGHTLHTHIMRLTEMY